MENIGTNNTKLSYNNTVTGEKINVDVTAANYNEAATFFMDWLEKQEDFTAVKAVGHRIVYGMHHTKPEIVTTALIEELKNISVYDPEHLPVEIALIELFEKRHPSLPQIACFDTSFHSDMPPVAKLLAIPRRFNTKGIQRYGFHGLSYAFLMEELSRLEGIEAARGRIVLAHLGSGASLAAVKNGKSMDTSMGFTPTSGLPMSTRSGDLDPGVAWYLMKVEKLTPEQFNHLTNHESGLLGISETSSDMRELMKNKDTDNRAAEAVELFCYQARKWIGSFAAVLGGLDTLVFTGGIGEHSPEVRSRICAGLGFLGIELDEIKNLENDAIISTDKNRVRVHVIPTNEEIMIARLVRLILTY